MDFTEIRLSGKTRREHDLLGEMEIPAEYYFGVQTTVSYTHLTLPTT